MVGEAGDKLIIQTIKGDGKRYKKIINPEYYTSN
jgi:hypothetical protein